MQKKNISTGADGPAITAELGEDDEIVKTVTTETRVGKRKRTPATRDLPDEPVFEIKPGEKVIDVEDDEDEADNTPRYSENSLAALLYGENEDEFESKHCTVLVRRNPDNMNDSFAKPCGSRMNLPKIANISIAEDRDDIEHRIRREYGGGHYFFQMHINGGLGPSWSATLADDSRHFAAVLDPAAANPQPAAFPPTPVASNPFESIVGTITMMKQVKDGLFGDEQRRMEEKIAKLEEELRSKPEVPEVRKSERLAILEAIDGLPSQLQTRALDSIFPPDDKESRHWAAELADVAIQNKETLMSVAGTLLSLLMPGAVPPLQQMPPQYMPPPEPTPLNEGPPKLGIFAPKSELAEQPAPETDDEPKQEQTDAANA